MAQVQEWKKQEEAADIGKGGAQISSNKTQTPTMLT
jgi:hypothetical protein